jgi:murein L,D-transpeptidase YcbB/YkuD
LTAKLGIQRQIPWDVKNNRPLRRTVARIAAGGSDVVGIYCHYHQTNNRGYGDPGPWLQQALKDAGYETYAFDGDDKEVWKQRQTALGITADGIPGPGTVRALAASGKKHGMFVQRPIDALID